MSKTVRSTKTEGRKSSLRQFRTCVECGSTGRHHHGHCSWNTDRWPNAAPTTQVSR